MRGSAVLATLAAGGLFQCKPQHSALAFRLLRHQSYSPYARRGIALLPDDDGDEDEPSKVGVPIDPLEYVKKSSVAPRTPMGRPVIRAGKMNSPGSDDDSSLTLSSSSSSSSDGGGGRKSTLPLEQQILLSEAQLLASLPTNALATYQQACSVIVPRLAFIILTLHVMLLIPALRYVKVDLHLSIAPFLYIGPALLLLPFIVYLLWETDVYEFWYITRGLERFIYTSKLRAVETLERDGPRMLYELQEDSTPDADTLKQLAYARLISKIDPEALCREAMALKRRRGKALSSAPPKSASDAPVDTTSSAVAMQSGSYFDAARRLIDDVAAKQGEGADDASVLAELRSLQEMLNKGNSPS